MTSASLDLLLEELAQPGLQERLRAVQELLDLDVEEAAPAFHDALVASLSQQTTAAFEEKVQLLLLRGLGQWNYKAAIPDVRRSMDFLRSELCDKAVVEALRQLGIVDELLPYWVPFLFWGKETAQEYVRYIADYQLPHAVPLLLLTLQHQDYKGYPVIRNIVPGLCTLKDVPMLLGLRMYPNWSVQRNAIQCIIHLYEQEPNLRKLMPLFAPKKREDLDPSCVEVLQRYTDLFPFPDWEKTLQAGVRWLKGESIDYTVFRWAQELETLWLERWPLEHPDLEKLWLPTLCHFRSAAVVPHLREMMNTQRYRMYELLEQMEPLSAPLVLPVLSEVMEDIGGEDEQELALAIATRVDHSFAVSLAHQVFEKSNVSWKVLRQAAILLRNELGDDSIIALMRDAIASDKHPKIQWEMASYLSEMGESFPTSFWVQHTDVTNPDWIETVMASFDNMHPEAVARVSGILLRDADLSLVGYDCYDPAEDLVDTLKTLKTPTADHELLEVFRSCSEDDVHELGLLSHTMRAMGERNLVEAMPEVLKWVKYARDDYCPAATMGVFALGQTKYLGAVPVLLEILHLDDMDSQWDDCEGIYEMAMDALESFCEELGELQRTGEISAEQSKVHSNIESSLIRLFQTVFSEPHISNYLLLSAARSLQYLDSQPHPDVVAVLANWLEEPELTGWSRFDDNYDVLRFEMILFAWGQHASDSLEWVEQRSSMVCSWLIPWWQPKGFFLKSKRKASKSSDFNPALQGYERGASVHKQAESCLMVLRQLREFHRVVVRQRNKGVFTKAMELQLDHWASTLLGHMHVVREDWEASDKDSKQKARLKRSGYLAMFETMAPLVQEVKESLLLFPRTSSTFQDMYEDSMFVHEDD